VFNRNFREQCCLTCCDLRAERKDVDFERAWNFTIVGPKADCTPRDTVAQMGAALRQSLRDQLHGKSRWSFLQGLSDQGVPNGSALEISHMGAVVLKRPITDFVGQIQMMEAVTSNCTSLLSYSKVREDSNQFHAGLRYAPGKISRDEARVVAALTEFALKEISPKMTVAEAIEAMSKVKSKIK
jgi:hypothetical protein